MAVQTHRRTLAEKQREIFEREADALRVARGLFEENGYLSLTMDRLADALGWSKPALYRHFRSKEEVVMGLAIENVRERIDWYQKAARLEGRPRERIVAISFLVEKLYPRHLEVEIVLYSSSIRAKTSPELQQELLEAETETLRILAGIVREAQSSGDLHLPGKMSAEDVVFGMWSLYLGAFLASNPNIPAQRMRGFDFPQPLLALRRYARAAIDGLGWKPLSTEWDYAETLRRVAAEFGDLLGANGPT